MQNNSTMNTSDANNFSNLGNLRETTEYICSYIGKRMEILPDQPSSPTSVKEVQRVVRIQASTNHFPKEDEVVTTWSEATIYDTLAITRSNKGTKPLQSAIDRAATMMQMIPEDIAYTSLHDIFVDYQDFILRLTIERDIGQVDLDKLISYFGNRLRLFYLKWEQRNPPADAVEQWAIRFAYAYRHLRRYHGHETKRNFQDRADAEACYNKRTTIFGGEWLLHVIGDQRDTILQQANWQATWAPDYLYHIGQQ